VRYGPLQEAFSVNRLLCKNIPVNETFAYSISHKAVWKFVYKGISVSAIYTDNY